MAAVLELSDPQTYAGGKYNVLKNMKNSSNGFKRLNYERQA
jgi:hypothetical protein